MLVGVSGSSLIGWFSDGLLHAVPVELRGVLGGGVHGVTVSPCCDTTVSLEVRGLGHSCQVGPPPVGGVVGLGSGAGSACAGGVVWFGRRPLTRLLSDCYARAVVFSFADFRDFRLRDWWNFGVQGPPGGGLPLLAGGVVGVSVLAMWLFRWPLRSHGYPPGPGDCRGGSGFAMALTGLTGSLRLPVLLRGGSGWPAAGALVGAAVGVGGDAQESGQGGGVGVGECGVGSFDAAEGGGGDAGGGGQLGLGHSPDDAPVSGVAVGGVDDDDLFDGGFEVSHDPGEEVDLGGSFSGFPVVDGGGGDVGHAGEVADADVLFSAGRGEGVGVESAQDSSRHPWPARRVIARQVHRTALKSVNHCVLLFRLSLEYGVGRTSR